MTNRHTLNLRIKPILLVTGVMVVAGAIGLGFLAQQTTAAPVVGFNAGNIIDDLVFTNKNSMGVGEIQSFLNSKVPVCDTWGTQPSEYGGGTRAQWAANASLHPSMGAFYPPFTCLKDYSENGKSAAQIIYDVAQQYTVNPQTLIVLLQKEQALVTDTWPSPTQYRTATGYGCPDTAPCDSQYYGLTNQLKWSGTMFRAIFDNSPTWYTPYVLGNNTVYFNPGPYNNATQSYYGRFGTSRDIEYCGSTIVNIQNRATQALYNYTPYQPNQASLDAGYGTASPCGAYGNRNFYLYFTDWFGSVRSNDTTRPHPDGTLVSFSGAAYLIENGALRHITNGFYFDINNYKWKDVKPATTGDRNLPKTTPIDYIKPGVFYRTSASNVYRTVVGGSTVSKQVVSYNSFIQLKDDWSKIPVIPDSVAPAITNSEIYNLGIHPDGSLISDGVNVYYLENGMRRYVKPTTFYSYQWSWGDIKTATEADKALPAGSGMPPREGAIVSSAGNLYVIDDIGGTTFMRPIGPWECYSNVFRYGTPSDNVVSWPSNEMLAIGARISCQ